MPVYEKAKPAVLDFIHRVAAQYHGELTEHGVTFGALMVHPSEGDESGECVLKHQGYPAAATIRPTKARQRLNGLPDALIEIDWLTWKDLPEEGRVALIDHELEHLELARDKDGNAKADDGGRPVLKTRRHDLVIGGFRSVIARHKAHALEFQQIRDLAVEYRQQVFAWGDDMAPPDDMDASRIADVA